jgi:hypothetical protein
VDVSTTPPMPMSGAMAAVSTLRTMASRRAARTRIQNPP